MISASQERCPGEQKYMLGGGTVEDKYLAGRVTGQNTDLAGGEADTWQ